MKFELYGESIKQDLISDCKKWISKSKTLSIKLQELIKIEREEEYRKSLH